MRKEVGMLICTLLLFFILFHLSLLQYFSSHLLTASCWLFFFLQSSFLQLTMWIAIYILWKPEQVCFICLVSSVNMAGFSFLLAPFCPWEWTSKCYKRSLRHELSFGHSRCMSETQAACKRCNPLRMWLDWLSWACLDPAKIYRDCVHAVSNEHVSWLSIFYHAALLTLSRMFCLLQGLFAPAVPSSCSCLHQPGNIPIAIAEFLIRFSIKWQAKVILISLYQGFLVNNFWRHKSYRCAW